MLIKRIATDRPDDIQLPRRVNGWRSALKAECRHGGADTGWTRRSPSAPALSRCGSGPPRNTPASPSNPMSPLAAVHQMVHGPDRLVVDIDGLDLSPTLRELVAKITSNDPYIQTVRVGQNRPRVVRLVFDLKERRLAAGVHAGCRSAGYRNRLVFDLYPVPTRPTPCGSWCAIPRTSSAALLRRAAAAPARTACPARLPLARRTLSAALVRKSDDEGRQPGARLAADGRRAGPSRRQRRRMRHPSPPAGAEQSALRPCRPTTRRRTVPSRCAAC
ncbi:AMIN domain-containing protein [Cupriavidus basilensis]